MTTHLAQRTDGASADAVAVNSLIDDGKAADPAFPAVKGIKKDIAAALVFYNKAVLRDPKSARASMALGHAQLRLAEEITASDPTRARATLVQARDSLASSTSLDGGNPFAWTQLGRAYGRLDDHVAAADAFQKALARDASFVAARFGLAVALFNQGQYEQARDEALMAKSGGDARADGLLRELDSRIAAQRAKASAAQR
jgi:tetratricopeptide (TPR) repeat protein